jgi:D-beta-D-heptose 7-phosphate kinase / D-beta-D-heptose 1-phosphate adenosyltransferase
LYVKPKILVAGDAMLDVYWSGTVTRISPEAPVPIVKINSEDYTVGGAANVAANCAALDCNVTLFALIGNDTHANQLREQLTDCGITLKALQDGRPTSKKLRIMSRHQQLIRLDFEEVTPYEMSIEVQEQIKSEILENDVIILSDYAKGMLANNVETLIKFARAKKKIVIVDPKGTNFRRYAGATLITPNFSEFELIVGTCRSKEEIISKGGKLRDDLQLDALLITKGENGMTLLEKGKEPLNLNARAREVFDVTGAGDTVVSTIAALLGRGTTLERAVMLANEAAAIVVGKLGTSKVTMKEIGEREHGEENTKIVSESQLMTLVEEAKKKSETVVFTNGCFDILHLGHVEFLRSAKNLGDRLIVAVNTDESVSRLKGKDRPINNYKARASVLSSMQCIDWVIEFSDDTPKKLIDKIIPDILVKGGDYSDKKIVGADTVEKNGGRVVILNFTEGFSTTNIINKIKVESKKG